MARMDGDYQRFGLTLMVNHACNLRCTYCYTGAKFQSPMPLLIGEVAIDRAMNCLEPSGVLDLGFFGGEPLLESDRILHWMRHARSRATALGQEINFNVTTNGTVQRPEAWEVMMDGGVDVTVSFDALPAVHDRHRRTASGQGTAVVVESTIRRLLEQGRALRVNVVVRPDNLEQVPEGLSYLENLGVRNVELSLDLWARWLADDLLRLEICIHHAAGLWRRWLPDFSLSWFEAKVAGLAQVPQSFASTRCGFGLGEVAVAPSGNLYPCERLIGEDQEQNPLRLPGHVLDGQGRLGRSPSAFKSCRSCESCLLQGACDTGCRCSNFIRTRDVNLPDELLCRLNQATAEAVSVVLSGDGFVAKHGLNPQK